MLVRLRAHRLATERKTRPSPSPLSGTFSLRLCNVVIVLAVLRARLCASCCRVRGRARATFVFRVSESSAFRACMRTCMCVSVCTTPKTNGLSADLWAVCDAIGHVDCSRVRGPFSPLPKPSGAQLCAHFVPLFSLQKGCWCCHTAMAVEGMCPGAVWCAPLRPRCCIAPPPPPPPPQTPGSTRAFGRFLGGSRRHKLRRRPL